MDRPQMITLVMALLVARAGLDYDLDDLACRAEDLIDAAEARAAETLADRAAMAMSAQALHQDDEETPEPVEFDVHNRPIRK